MADISIISRLVDGITRNTNIANNTLVTTSIKVGGPTTNTELTKAILDGLISAASNAGHLVTLSGVAAGSDNLGTFTGSTIADSDTIKRALQDLETAHETTDGKAGHLVTLSGVAASADSLGTFTGTTITDNDTIKQALQDLETAHESLASSASTVSGKVNDLITLSGVAANSTNLGTFTGNTIADSSTAKAALQTLETAVETKAADSAVIKKDGTVAFTGDQSMGTHKLSNLSAGTVDADAVNFKQLTDGLALKVNKAGDTMTGFLTLHADPTSAMHAVTKRYADAIAAGFDAHASVMVATTANVTGLTASGSGVGKTLSDFPATLDGYTIQAGDRILVKDQTTQADNGVYTYLAGVLTRATDFDGSPTSEVVGGDTIYVVNGTTNGGATWTVINASGFVVIDTYPLVFTQVAGVADVQAGTGLSKVGAVLNTNIDNVTIGINGSDAIYVKNTGIDTAQLADNAVTAGKIATSAISASGGLTGGGGTAIGANVGGGLTISTNTIVLASGVAGEALGLTAGVLDVKTDATTIEVASDVLRIKDLGVSSAKLAATSVTAAKLGSDVAGTGLTGGNGSALAIDFGVSGSKAISATDLASTATGKGASLIGIFDTAEHFAATTVEAALAESAVKIEALQAGSVAIDLTFMNSTGSQISTGSVVILSQSAAGKIELAKADALATCEGVIGVVVADIADGASGKVRVCGEATVSVDASLDLGKRAYVSAANAGKAAKTAPLALNSVIFLLGIASATNKVVLQAHLEAVNE